jgi:hypothetical protein
MSSVTQQASWKALKSHFEAQGKQLKLSDLFQNQQRFQQFSQEFKSTDGSILLEIVLVCGKIGKNFPLFWHFFGGICFFNPINQWQYHTSESTMMLASY